MRRLLSAVILFSFILAGCKNAPQSNLGRVPRNTLSEAERAELFEDLSGQQASSGADIYNEDGVIITSTRHIEISTWKLNALAEAYEKQNDMGYITDTYELSSSGDYWMAHRVTTKDFQFDAKLSGDDVSMELDMRLLGDYNFVIVPRGCIINGVFKDTLLFKGSEPEKGRFIVSAKMSDFETLSLFGLTMENISSIAWLLTAINTETREMQDFLIATAFPVTEVWGGIQVSEKFSVDEGIVMWVERFGESAYLCTFNGSEEKIVTDITVTAEKGNLISDIYTLDVSSGECTFTLLGYDVTGIEAHMGDVLLHSES